MVYTIKFRYLKNLYYEYFLPVALITSLKLKKISRKMTTKELDYKMEKGKIVINKKVTPVRCI